MLSHISACSSTTAFFNLRSSLCLTSSKRFNHLFPFKSQPRPRFSFLPSRSSSSMDSPPSIAAVDSISDDLRNQTLNSSNEADVSNSSETNNGSSDINGKNLNKGLKLTLEDLNWDHSFVRELPGDPRTDIIPREVLHSCYTKVSPSAEVENPQLVCWSESVAELLDLDPKEFERSDFPLIFSGASPLVGGVSYAQCYGGHQFGMWAGQLGDGRAITLGELLNSKSERWELQLKGAGKTPYSRFADGLAVLRSSIREFLCSEAMHFLGIPTTRALCLVTTGKYVVRDMFYDGNPKEEPGAIVCRVAPSFLRFGSYQIHASRANENLDIVRTLADYTIRHHYPHLEHMEKSESVSFSTGEEDNEVVDLTSNKYAAWAVEVSERTASLVAKWQGVGFTHGVLNTDNMSVLGLTIDYGPFGFLDAFDPSYTPNTTDLPGRRYCFANQPDVCLWNIAQFTTTLSAAKLISEKEANYVMERYGTKFMDDYQYIMTQKLGLPKYNKQLLSKLLNNMAVDKVDYTNFFRLLSNIKADPTIPEDELLVPLKAALLDIGKERKEAWTSWVQSYIQELSTGDISDEQRKASMDSVNPKYVLRNYLCQSAIDAAEMGDFEEVRRLLKLIERPFDEQPGMEKYARLPPAWAYRPGVCMLSCSS
ncbi:OLC1v1005841C1 [Oldenlandia corymbosa var. corymbosa]|uniref:Selenoprotein O n=1 Tax=Oldenlandia corymbosa var. corymbosa TaxID=529605 RepID=A0AAV1DG80_OLDCO|nr:OLC1v1005841C1 [Oldenlandia corymbosa var. corymbosa]